VSHLLNIHHHGHTSMSLTECPVCLLSCPCPALSYAYLRVSVRVPCSPRYCLMAMVELLCGVLAGPPALFGTQVGMSMNPRALGRKQGGGSIAHFFMAVDPKSPGACVRACVRARLPIVGSSIPPVRSGTTQSNISVFRALLCCIRCCGARSLRRLRAWRRRVRRVVRRARARSRPAAQGAATDSGGRLRCRRSAGAGRARGARDPTQVRLRCATRLSPACRVSVQGSAHSGV
jgi:hypothetical protein